MEKKCETSKSCVNCGKPVSEKESEKFCVTCLTAYNMGAFVARKRFKERIDKFFGMVD